jgi:hypothetical protein
MEIYPVYLILADISGYTGFVKAHKDCLLHAEQIISDLLEAVIHKIEPPLQLNKLEGDAAFFYAKAKDRGVAAPGITRQVLSFLKAYKDKQQALIKAGEGGCACAACRNIDKLNLKAILHYGRAVIKHIHRLEELAGEDVITAHRLLKNKVPASEYIMMTEDFYNVSGGVADNQPELYIEQYEGIGEVRTMLYYPETFPLEVPATERMTRLSGRLEALRLDLKAMWRRFTRPKLIFHNLTD